jgi:hypothetical protein
MLFEIKDNFLPQKNFENIRNFILNQNFSWNLTSVVSNEEENLPVNSSYYFTHDFWSGFHTEPEAQIFAPILNEIECRAIIRIKGNLYPSTEKIIHHMDHIDYEFPHRGAIFYLNSNNGFTVIDGKKIESVENRLLLFNPTILHHSTTCTDNKCRLNVNFNFF